MDFRLAHVNINVLSHERSIAFYQEALGLRESRRKTAQDGSYSIVWLTDEAGLFELELTCLAGRTVPYDLGDNESHIAFVTRDMEAARALHRRMGCICFENPAVGVYFIEDPDGYWLEIVPAKG